MSTSLFLQHLATELAHEMAADPADAKDLRRVLMALTSRGVLSSHEVEIVPGSARMQPQEAVQAVGQAAPQLNPLITDGACSEGSHERSECEDRNQQSASMTRMCAERAKVREQEVQHLLRKHPHIRQIDSTHSVYDAVFEVPVTARQIWHADITAIRQRGSDEAEEVEFMDAEGLYRIVVLVAIDEASIVQDTKLLVNFHVRYALEYLSRTPANTRGTWMNATSFMDPDGQIRKIPQVKDRLIPKLLNEVAPEWPHIAETEVYRIGWTQHAQQG